MLAGLPLIFKRLFLHSNDLSTICVARVSHEVKSSISILFHNDALRFVTCDHMAYITLTPIPEPSWMSILKRSTERDNE